MIRKLLVEGPAERWDGVTEALLHFAARRDHLRIDGVAGAASAAPGSICDRFANSTMAYQGYGHGVDRAMLGHALRHRRRRLPARPHADPRPAGRDRPGARRGTARHARRATRACRSDFHERVRAGFLDIAEAEPERCVVIDATAGIDDDRRGDRRGRDQAAWKPEPMARGKTPRRSGRAREARMALRLAAAVAQRPAGRP